MIESTLAQQGFTPVLCTQSPGGVTDDEYVEMLLDRQVSGIIFVAGLHADTTASREVLRLLRTAVDRHAQTVVMVTHDPYAAAHADRVLLLADGRVVDVLEQPSGAPEIAVRMARLEER